MEQLIILQGITVDHLLTQIRAILEKEMSERLTQLQSMPPVKHLTIEEVAKELHVSKVTLFKWIKLGYLKSYRIGRRVLFKSDEIEQSLKIGRFRQ